MTTSYEKFSWQKPLLTLLRMAVGWHFLYEGVSKLTIPGWSASAYLLHATGPLAGLFHQLANSPGLLLLTNQLNIYGLLLIGLALFLGFAIRPAALAGILMLLLYYLAYPPFGFNPALNQEAHYYIVDKLFMEALLLLLIFFTHQMGYTLQAWFADKMISKKTGKPTPEDPSSRREALKNLATLPALGVMGWGAYRHLESSGVDVMTGATIKVNQTPMSDLKGELPKGKIGKHEISRLIAGGNLIGGWAHSRDLIYVSTLFKAYNTEQKVYETLMLAEQAGINTINIGFSSIPLLMKYKKMSGSKIQVISQVAPHLNSKELKSIGPATDPKLYFEFIEQAIDAGVDILQVQGNWCDWLVRDGKPEVIGKMLERIREQGYTAGLGAHSVESLIACKELGIVPDYYMKTMHHDQYWSAHPRENRFPFEVDGKEYLDHNRFHNNMFCLFPERTVEFVSKSTVPVMGFKVLAAGAITPEDGFKWAYNNGADFICVGMFDFQVVSNVNTAIHSIQTATRTRPWYG
ncbi:MAG: DoxX family membrane protein [Marinilabiliales bacterium]|nr:DoxX family membrane protein [Marinilabiliales bacterium]